MVKRFEQYQDMIAKLYPPKKLVDENGEKILSRPITFCVTSACQLRCKYCYEQHKGNSYMKFETAKKFIDLLLTGDKGMNQYITPENSPAVALEFIGGEPFMAIDLIDQIVDYWMDATTEMMHPWADKFILSICSNGVAYFDPKVQNFLEKHKNHLSFSVTIDGNQELHDACRVYAGTNKGCYKEAMAAAQDWMDKGNYMGSKVTLSPENLKYMYSAIMHMVDNGYYEILGNCVYEAEWTNEDALLFYNEGKKLADEFLRRNMDFDNDYYCSLFEPDFFKPKESNDIENWCWGKGTPILTVNGYKPIEEIKIGDLVYTEDGTVQPVINTMSHMADNVVNISVSGAFNMVCTDDHKLFVKPFDYIGNGSVKHYKEYEKVQVKDIQHNDLIKLFQLPTNNVICDIDLAYVVGRYIGDGWHSTTGYKICCAHDEESDLKDKLDKAKIEYSIDDYPTVKQFNLFKSNTELLRILSCCGENAGDKHLPSECFNWCRESLQSMLNGYMDADGTINNMEQYRFNTVSYTLAQELMVILRTLGYTPTCYHNKRGGKSVILGRQVNIKDRYEVYYYGDSNRSRYVHEDEDGMWTYGLKVTNAEPQIVYNITVGTNHSYVAGGIVSSNCGGTGSMIACDWDGEIYPCIRYMEMSLGNDQPKMPIGDVDNGLMQTEEHLKTVETLRKINRRTQSTDECFYCSIAEGCSWCSAWNYQLYGTADKRCTRICPMHKSRALFNYYFWNKYYRANNQNKRMKIYIPDEWALEIIDENELNMLKDLAREDYINEG